MIVTQALIIAACQEIGFAAGETPNTDELAVGLLATQNLFDSWSAQALPIPDVSYDALPLTGAPSYVLGFRPIKIKSADINTGMGLIVPLKLATAEEWAAGFGSSVAPALFHDGGYPSATIRIRPAVSGTLELYTYKPFTPPADLTTDLDLPPGYSRALIFELALDLAPKFGYPVTDDLRAQAKDAKLSIVGLNAATLGQPVPVGPQPTSPQG